MGEGHENWDFYAFLVLWSERGGRDRGEREREGGREWRGEREETWRERREVEIEKRGRESEGR